MKIWRWHPDAVNGIPTATILPQGRDPSRPPQVPT